MLRADRVSISYGKKRVIENLDLTIAQGKSLAVIGPSGCGKSSLLYLLSGLRRPSSGRVLFNGHDLWQREQDRLKLRRTHFGFVFQQPFLINYLTVLENICVAALDESAAEDRGRVLLQQLRMDGMEDKFPYELSGGQRQRVAIGRALINSPKVIFADEPTASLDSSNAATVVMLLKDYQKANGSAMVMVTHDNRLLEGFDEVLNMESENV